MTAPVIELAAVRARRARERQLRGVRAPLGEVEILPPPGRVLIEHVHDLDTGRRVVLPGGVDLIQVVDHEGNARLARTSVWGRSEAPFPLLDWAATFLWDPSGSWEPGIDPSVLARLSDAPREGLPPVPTSGAWWRPIVQGPGDLARFADPPLRVPAWRCMFKDPPPWKAPR